MTDRIHLYMWDLSATLADACARHEDFIREEVLAEDIIRRALSDSSEEWTFDGERARVGIERVHKGG